MSGQSVQEWLAGYRKAWVERDAEAAAMLFTEDSQYREQPFQDAFQGVEGVRDYWARVTATQADIALDWGTPITDGDRTAVEWWVRLTNAGEPVTLAGSMTLLFAPDGRCRELREYWHYATEQVPPPQGWGA
jgi:nuclear transport factor 2 (NTF2) superfamily protein